MVQRVQCNSNSCFDANNEGSDRPELEALLTHGMLTPRPRLSAAVLSQTAVWHAPQWHAHETSALKAYRAGL